jgi:hypothetical protein
MGKFPLSPSHAGSLTIFYQISKNPLTLCGVIEEMVGRM